MAGTIPGAIFVGSVLGHQASSQPISFPTGTQAGDIAFIMGWQGFSDGGSISGGAGGWTKSSLEWNEYGYWSAVFYKTLVAGDLAGVTMSGTSGAAYAVAVYRNASAVAVKELHLGAGGISNLTFAGFTKSGVSRGIISIVQDRNPGSVPSAPAGHTSRGHLGSTYFTADVADLLQVGSYVNGAPIKWDDFVSGNDQVGWLFELT